jgi:hypothetical protein
VARDIKIQFLGDASDLNRATRSASGDLDKFSKHAGTVAGVVSSVTTAAINAASAGARALVDFTKGAIAEAEEAQRIGKVTATLIKSTGGAANVSGQQISDLTEHLSNLSGIDDEVIQAGTNVMLTFRKVRNEAGKGNKIFDRSQQAALDLSAVLGTDLKSANLQLGKALNDPVKGMTALRRSGISFTQQQIDQVKAMVASNDTLGAQRLILDEVQKEVGGAAEANATATQKMSTAWSNFKEDIGTLILPAFTSITDTLINTVLPGIEDFARRAIDVVSRFGRDIADAFMAGFRGEDFSPADGLVGVIQRIARAGGAGLDATVKALQAIGKWAQDNAEPLKVAGVALASFATSLAAISAAQKAAGAVQTLGQAVLGIGAAFGPWGLLAAAIIAVGAAAVYAYQHWQPFRDAVDGVVDAVSNAIDWFERLPVVLKVAVAGAAIVFAPVTAAIAGVVLAVRHWDDIKRIATEVWQAVSGAVSTALAVVVPIVQNVIDFLVSVWARYGDEVTGILTSLVELFAAIWQRIVEIVSIAIAVLTPVFDIVRTVWNIALIGILTMVQVFVLLIQQFWAIFGQGIINTIRIVWSVVANVIEGALRIIQGIIQIATGLISGDWGKAWQGVKNILSGAWQGIKAIIDGVLNFFRTTWSTLEKLITDPFAKAQEAIKKLFSGFADIIKAAFDGAVGALKDALNALIDVMNSAINAYNKIPLAPDIPNIPGVRGAAAPSGRVMPGALRIATPSLLAAPRGVATPVQTFGGIVINMPAGADGANVVNAITRYTRRNGATAWRR